MRKIDKLKDAVAFKKNFMKFFQDGGDLNDVNQGLEQVTPLINAIGGQAAGILPIVTTTLGGIQEHIQHGKNTRRKEGLAGRVRTDTNPYMRMGGRLKEFFGPKHENGGIPIDGDMNVNYANPDAEVEGGETGWQYEDGGYIFSDKLGMGGATFADHSKAAAKKFKREDEITTNTRNKTMEKLSKYNDFVKEAGSLYEMANGGKMKKYTNGGPYDPIDVSGRMLTDRNDVFYGLERDAAGNITRAAMAHGDTLLPDFGSGIFDNKLDALTRSTQKQIVGNTNPVNIPMVNTPITGNSVRSTNTIDPVNISQAKDSFPQNTYAAKGTIQNAPSSRYSSVRDGFNLPTVRDTIPSPQSNLPANNKLASDFNIPQFDTYETSKTTGQAADPGFTGPISGTGDPRYDDALSPPPVDPVKKRSPFNFNDPDDLNKASLLLKGAGLARSFFDSVQKPEQENLQLNPRADEAIQIAERLGVNAQPIINEINLGTNQGINQARNVAGSAITQQVLAQSAISKGQRAIADTRVKEQAQNNQFRANEASMKAQLGQQEANERIRQQTAQSQNDAANRMFKRDFASNLTQIGSQFNKQAETQKLQENINDLASMKTKEGMAILSQKYQDFTILPGAMDEIKAAHAEGREVDVNKILGTRKTK